MTSLMSHDVISVTQALCEGLATPISLSVSILVKYGEWDQLASKEVDPIHYLDAERYWADAQAVGFLRKCDGLPTTFDRKAKAVDQFFLCERECYRANERISPFLFGAHALGEEGLASFIDVMRKNVQSWLGPCPSSVEGRFGPGATYGDKGKLSTVPDKMSSRPTLTASALGFLFPWVSTAWARASAAIGCAPQFISGNRFTAVPKDAKKFRGIAIEPSINLFYQLGYGRVLRKRLCDSGIDLNIGQDIHRQVACDSSVNEHMSTIDLSNASDTVCRNLVKLLLPKNWYETLDALRSPTTLIEGREVRLEKFSSMGNGFTFELETVIFAAICSAAMESCGIQPRLGVNLFVYGDDIIVPTECTKVLVSALRFFGLTPNESKSFFSGPFRESCGGDFFGGVDVRPYFLKELPYEPQHFIAMANGLRRVAYSNGHNVHRSSSVLNCWFRILDVIPSAIRRLRGPQDLGDIVIHDNEERWQTRVRHSIRYIRCYRPALFREVSWKHFKPEVVLATAVYQSAPRLPLGSHGSTGVTPRDSVAGYKIGWVPRS